MILYISIQIIIVKPLNKGGGYFTIFNNLNKIIRNDTFFKNCYRSQSIKSVKDTRDEISPTVKVVKSTKLDKLNLINDKYSKQLKIYKTIKTSLKSIAKN